MTYEDREVSNEQGAPILLLVFALGTTTWHYARADQAIEIDEDTYLPMPIEITPVRASGESVRNDVRLTVPRDFPIAELWRVSPPTDRVGVILKELHDGDDDTISSWIGHVSNVGWPTPATAELLLTHGSMALKATGPRRRCQKNCPHVLYGADGCKLDRDAYRVSATITDKTALTLTAVEFGTGGKYVGGYLAWTRDGIPDYRLITAHSGEVITLQRQAPDLAIDDAVDAFEGCDRTLVRCAELDNVPNYGGLPYFASKNPFDGNPVF